MKTNQTRINRRKSRKTCFEIELDVLMLSFMVEFLRKKKKRTSPNALRLETKEVTEQR